MDRVISVVYLRKISKKISADDPQEKSTPFRYLPDSYIYIYNNIYINIHAIKPLEKKRSEFCIKTSERIQKGIKKKPKWSKIRNRPHPNIALLFPATGAAHVPIHPAPLIDFAQTKRSLSRRTAWPFSPTANLDLYFNSRNKDVSCQSRKHKIRAYTGT